MAEKNAKSKLKRKKLFVEDHQAEISSKGTLNRSHTTECPSSETTAVPRRWVFCLLGSFFDIKNTENMHVHPPHPRLEHMTFKTGVDIQMSTLESIFAS